MMENQSTAKRHSGFTLLEMMIVLGIIGILTAVLIPTMSGYMTRSRLNTANANAKVLFNSIQTVMQEYEFKERTAKESMFYGTTKTGNVSIYCVNGTIQSVVTSAALTVTADQIGANPATAGPTTLGSRLNRLYDSYGETTWSAYIENYSVRAVLCATGPNVEYVGGYPKRIEERGAVTTSVSTSTNNSFQDLKAYAASAWA